MKRSKPGFLIVALILSSAAFAQQSTEQQAKAGDQSTRMTIRGCIRSERQSYVLIADKTGTTYALQGVGNKLQPFLRKEVEVTGETKPGTVKTGIRPEKSGSNPSDTVHGVDGVPLEVADIEKDIRVIANHCKAADAK
jgi:hypothetical protein